MICEGVLARLPASFRFRSKAMRRPNLTFVPRERQRFEDAIHVGVLGEAGGARRWERVVLAGRTTDLVPRSGSSAKPGKDLAPFLRVPIRHVVHDMPNDERYHPQPVSKAV